MTSPAAYILHYWPVIPGRGEFVKLAFESVAQAYTEKSSPMDVVMKTDKTVGHPPHFAPPVLEVVTERKGPSAFISQTPAILAYLAPILGLDGKSSSSSSSSDAAILRAHVQQLTQTVLDLNNETHDVHHPISSAAFYEDQKDEAIKRASDFRATRVPKFFTLFQKTLQGNPAKSDWLLASSHFTVADLCLFQVVDGPLFAFPRLMSALKASGKYDLVFGLHDKVAAIDTIQAYLKSDRRRGYSNGVFRHYPELDGDE